jgi:two-component system, chemotaxis family, protein-glutamate methylesterase/glutaminase
MPRSRLRFFNSSEVASRPPAEAPIPTMGKSLVDAGGFESMLLSVTDTFLEGFLTPFCFFMIAGFSRLGRRIPAVRQHRTRIPLKLKQASRDSQQRLHLYERAQFYTKLAFYHKHANRQEVFFHNSEQGAFDVTVLPFGTASVNINDMGKEKIILVIGASAGGTTALPEVVKQINGEFKLSVFVVMHLSKSAIGDLLVKRLQKYTSYNCKMAEHGETLKEAHIYIARPDHHMLVKEDRIVLGRGPMENRYRPSIDALFRSAAVAFPSKAIGVILTGMLEDGASGMYAIKKSGGVCIVQDPAEAKYPDMPQAVLNVLEPDFSVPVSEIGEAIKKAIAVLQKRKKAKIPDDILKEAEIAERVNVGIEQIENLGIKSSISCPECGGALWELKDNGFSRYRCHVGHAFTEQGLITSMEASTESTLWIALRMIEERKNILKQIADKELKRGSRKLASTYMTRSKEMEAHVNKIKELLFSLGSDPQ